MEKRYIILSLLIFSGLFSGRALAQDEVGILRNLTDKLSEYTARIPREEIYIHSDREEYISGEDFWFNIFLFDRKSLKLSANSKIVYVEVLDAANRPVIQRRVFIREGTGPGHFVLPDTLSTGYYTLRAYTNWMKNFLPVNCFMKEIIVFNTLNNEQPRSIRHSLPSAYRQNDKKMIESGISVNFTTDSVEIFFKGNESISQYGNIFYMVMQTRGNLNYACKLLKYESGSHCFVPRKNLMPGINQVNIFDYTGKPVAEKLIYTPSDKPHKYSINTENSYGKRDLINLNITSALNQSPGKFSVSVYNANDKNKPLNIEEYLIFGSEFNTSDGIISPQTLSGKSPAETDSILSGLSSNWIRWQDILSLKFPLIDYPFEREFHYLRGRIADGNRDTVLLCFPGKVPWFQYTIADDKGNFCFNLHIDEEIHDLIIMTDPLNGKKVLLESLFPDNYVRAGNRNEVEDLSTSDYSKMGINFQVAKIFRTVAKGAFLPPMYEALKPVSFYGLPANEVRLSDFIELPDMSEVFLELIPDVSLRQRRTGYEIIISDRINDRPFILNPELLIDGVLVRDASLIAIIQPELVEKIDIVKRKYLVGGFLFNGIVNVITRAADFSCIPLPDPMTRVAYRIAEPVPVFISPEYSDAAARYSRIPDYRNTLYWNPSLSFNDTVGFRSSDNSMKCSVNIQGVTGEGLPFSIHRIISVE